MKWYLWGKRKKGRPKVKRKAANSGKAVKTIFFLSSASLRALNNMGCFQSRKGQLKHTFCSKTAQAIANVSNIF